MVIYGILIYLAIGLMIAVNEIIQGILTYPMIMVEGGRMARIKQALASIDGLWRKVILVMFVWPIIPVGIAVRWYHSFNR